MIFYPLKDCFKSTLGNVEGVVTRFEFVPVIKAHSQITIRFNGREMALFAIKR